MPTVKLGAQESAVVLPPFADREDLYRAWTAAGTDYGTLLRVCAAALGICVPRVARRPRVGEWDRNPQTLHRYGGAVLESYRGEVSQVEIIEAGGTVLRLCTDSLLPAGEVERKRDFTEASGGDSTAG